MRHRIGLPCLALMLTVSIARADILPTPDRGPPMGSAGGLDFAIQSIKVEMGPVNGPHYSKTAQIAVLVGCTDGQPNCALVESRCGAVAVGRTYLLPPLSSGGALVVQP